MYFLKSQIPEFQELTRTQRRTVSMAYQRKCYRWTRYTLPKLLLFPLGLVAIALLKPVTDNGLEIVLITHPLFLLLHHLVLTVSETNQLATFPEFIEAAKDRKA